MKNRAKTLLALLLLTVGMLSGCAGRKSRAFPWATAILVRPTPAKPAANPANEGGDAEPDLRMAVPPVSPHVIPTRTSPARPRVPAAPSEDATAKTESPLIAPELSSREVSAAQSETNESLGAASRNLDAARGRKLNAVQVDLVSKVHGFINGARDAMRSGDWTSARNLARKAQVLSEQLIASF